MAQAKRNPRKHRGIWVAAALAALTAAACSQLQRMERQLPAADRAFILEVRYIITTEERRHYVNIPAADRPEFRRDFWKRRDPSPGTERNEYRDTYYQRVEEANRLFRTEGRRGWLTDRGRVYVLLGPPDHREVYPLGYSFYEPPVEIWRYGFFPIIFVDRFHQGKYEIAMANAYYLNAVANAQMQLNQPQESLSAKKVQDFRLGIRKPGGGITELRLEVPYSTLLFTQKGDKYKAVVQVQVALTAGDKEIWKGEQSYPIVVTKEELEKLQRVHSLDFRTGRVAPGEYILKVRVVNEGEEQAMEKNVKIRVQ